MRDLYRIILDLYRLIRDLYRFILDLYRFILDLYRLFWIYTGYSGFIPVYTGFIPVYTGLYRFYPRAGVKVSLAVLIRGGLPGRRTSTSQIGILLHVLSRDASILGIVTCAWLLSWHYVTSIVTCAWLLSWLVSHAGSGIGCIVPTQSAPFKGCCTLFASLNVNSNSSGFDAKLAAPM